METKTCLVCDGEMKLFDHDDEDGNFAGWEWVCDCGNTEEE